MPSLSGKKRSLDGSAPTPKAKKSKLDSSSKKIKPPKEEKAPQPASSIPAEDMDFPRGGGTSFTPLEVKAIRAEAVKEANNELFQDSQEKPTKRAKRKADTKDGGEKKAKSKKGDTVRVEHLNYKRITVGMKIFGQIMSIQPLALIISLPNQLLAHVPITHISTELTSRLDSMDEDEDDQSNDDEESSSGKSVPTLADIFHEGQYVRAVVSAIHPPGSSDVLGIGRTRDDVQKASRRVELTLQPEKVNEGIVKSDLRKGYTLSASVKSVEDHGYILNLGTLDASGFLSFKDAGKAALENDEKFPVGHLLDICVSKVSGNGRTVTVSVDPEVLTSSSLSEITNVTSLLPGTLVQTLVTAVVPNGLNLQVLGYFGGTIDQFHLRQGDVGTNYTVGQKLKARVLYDIAGSSPPRFALSLAKHIVLLRDKSVGPGDDDASTIQKAFPIGTILDAVKVLRVEAERGLVVEVSPGLEGFVHISQTSDDHVPTLSASSGPWKLETTHRARVTGYFPFDGLLQLSLRSSVLEQKFIQVGEVQAGEVVRGTIRKLTDAALFVSISGNVDGVVWPNHFADIHLKHPQKRFKSGGSIKCRVLVVDPERRRIVLTAKKTLVESSLPIVAKAEDAKVGLVTHAVVFKASDKSLQVEFYNNLKAIVPLREVSETAIGPLTEAFPAGKVVQVRITSVNPETNRIVASIRQAAPNFKSAITDISDVEIGNSVEGVVSELQKDKLVITLHPSQVRALLSFTNLANRRSVPIPQLRASLKVGEKLEGLVVTARNAEKGFVLVATKPKEGDLSSQKGLSLDSIKVGQVVRGRVLQFTSHGTLLKVASHVIGLLHPTDTCDNYDDGTPFPSQSAILETCVLAVDKEKRQLILSTRPSRLHTEKQDPITDREITSLDDLEVGSTVRGFIKTVAEHGVFVSLGRGIDARVQIRELFDDFVKDWKSHFSAHKLVKGRIVGIDKEKRQVEMSFRSQASKRDPRSSLQLSNLVEGAKVDGVVKKIEDYGLFIEIEGSKIRGLCHKSELSDNKDADVSMALRSFREGDHVKVKVLSIDTERRRLSLGLKPSYFEQGDFQTEGPPESDDEEEAEPEGMLGVVEESDSDAEQEGDDPNSDDDEDQDGMDVDEQALDVDTSISFPKVSDVVSEEIWQAPAALQLDKGFEWSAEQEQDSDPASSSSSGEEDDSQEKKKKKRRRKEIEQDLTADLHTKKPESNADFERHLLGSPNSSFLWVQYMSFQLQLSEVEKAREIARRALQTISFREEQEKLNVWIALLNIENIYGTEESMETTFKDAARHNDSKTVHLRLAAIFEQSEKLEKAEEQFKRTSKKFGQSSKVWTLFGEYYLKHGKPELCRALLPRSLQSLEKHKHLKTISKFAQLEYKFGDPERGKTIFEGIVDSHPKRWDLWSIYLDMEAGQGDIASLRNLFDRVLAQKMTSHKAKSFFKKWLELERRLGDEDGAEAVKAKAVEWTQRANQ